MVAAGLLGGLALGLAHITRQTLSTRKGAEIAVAENNLRAKITFLLYESQACKNTLSKKTVTPLPNTHGHL